MIKNVSASNLARYVLSYTTDRQIRMTHLKLHKVLYYIQGYHLQKYGEPLFCDEIQAWPYGPVIPNVYNQYLTNGALPLICNETVHLDICDEQRLLIDKVIALKSPLPASRLVADTHKEDPWAAVEPQVLSGKRVIISLEAMHNYFVKLEAIQ